MNRPHRCLQFLLRSARVARFALRNPRISAQAVERQLQPQDRAAAFTQYRDGLPSIAPLSLRPDPALASRPRLNVLLPGMAMRSMSGGPNTAINLVYRLTQYGIPLRFVSTDIAADQDTSALRQHFSALTGMPPADCGEVEIVCGSNRGVALPVGTNDVFFASAWWNVQMIKYALPLMRQKRFFYIVQDYEPGLYAWSTEYALALETYGLDFDAVICGRLLAEYLTTHGVGRFADRGFLDQHTVTFEPAIDRGVFHPEERVETGRRRLLFYARPTSARRNMFELGLYALRTAVESGVFDGEAWEFLFMGEALPAVDLGRGMSIRSAPWADYPGYGAMLRGSDVALSLMLSPHTSYPPLEMAACGRLVVTNSFANKTADALRGYSPNIVPVPATLDGVVGGLAVAVRRTRAGERDLAPPALPATWSESFAEAVPWLAGRVRAAMEQVH
ncbi:MAG: hypothetical protein IOD03_20410 [Methylocystis sp.]|nr:hypothetical protein [Acidobacteriaceae bacterium]MCA3213358.1 hypothetical protein [Burkholderiales bacterium]MCA3475575.1 hypothetical protein [Rhodobacter sp.]MCA3586025.1 hypothetical protein [Methylocystis sp.]MCA4910078.1 hypothetical protein [Methylobacterium sp.]